MKMKYPGKRITSPVKRLLAVGNKNATRIKFDDPDNAAKKLAQAEEEYMPEEWL